MTEQRPTVVDRIADIYSLTDEQRARLYSAMRKAERFVTYQAERAPRALMGRYTRGEWLYELSTAHRRAHIAHTLALDIKRRPADD